MRLNDRTSGRVEMVNQMGGELLDGSLVSPDQGDRLLIGGVQLVLDLRQQVGREIERRQACDEIHQRRRTVKPDAATMRTARRVAMAKSASSASPAPRWPREHHLLRRSPGWQVEQDLAGDLDGHRLLRPSSHPGSAGVSAMPADGSHRRYVMPSLVCGTPAAKLRGNGVDAAA